MSILDLLFPKRAEKRRRKEEVSKLDGFEAYRNGFKLDENPFPKHSGEHSIWRDDWLFSAGRFM